MGPSMHAGPAIGAFGGAPYGATKRVRGVPTCVARTLANCATGALRWGSLWGHETCEGCAEMGAGNHVDPATVALGGAPYGATKRVRGAPKWGRVIMWTLPRWP